MGSRGSVIPFFNQRKDSGVIPITDERMTRFMISLEQEWNLYGMPLKIWLAVKYMLKIPSMKVTDLAEAVAPGVKHEIIGIRPGEKLHEQMIGEEDSLSTFEYDEYYKILPVINDWKHDPKRIKDGIKVEDGFTYNSGTNNE